MKKNKSHGGKRKNSGRKPKEPTKTKRIPVAIEDVIDSIIAEHKKSKE